MANIREMTPTLYRPNLGLLMSKTLRELGIRVLALDWDQCVYSETTRALDPVNTGAIAQWLAEGVIQEVAIVSNSAFRNRDERQVWMRELLAEYHIHPTAVNCLGPKESKPKPDGYYLAQAQLRCTPSEMLVIDDQPCSGIRGGNRGGFPTCLVDPVGSYGWRTYASGRFARNWYARRQLGLGQDGDEGLFRWMFRLMKEGFGG